MSTDGERLARLEERMTDVEADVQRLDIEVNVGQPGRPAVRSRLHQLEQFNAAAKAAEAARHALKSALAAKATRGERRLTVLIAGVNLLVVAAGVVIAILYHQ